jgi:predicted amidophosphoribosyltransferase
VGITPLPRFGSPVSLQPPVGWLRYVRSAPLSIFFPAGCRICDRMLTEATRIPICNECLGSFQQILGTVCDKCDAPVENAPTENKHAFVCPRCTGPDHRNLAFDRVRSWSFYDGAMVQAIHS